MYSHRSFDKCLWGVLPVKHQTCIRPWKVRGATLKKLKRAWAQLGKISRSLRSRFRSKLICPPPPEKSWVAPGNDQSHCKWSKQTASIWWFGPFSRNESKTDFVLKKSDAPMWTHVLPFMEGDKVIEPFSKKAKKHKKECRNKHFQKMGDFVESKAMDGRICLTDK